MLKTLENLAIQTAFLALEKQLKTIPPEVIATAFRRFGLAFGPAGLRHFSELNAAEQADLLARVPVLGTTHVDWAKPFQWIPRTWTTWVGPEPTAADILDGNITELKPILRNGEYYVLRGYIAETTIDGWHYRIGWRWDDVDKYWTLSFTVKKVN